MLNWLRSVFIGCFHHWEVLQKIEAQYVRGGGETHIWVQKCKKCGKLHNHRLG